MIITLKGVKDIYSKVKDNHARRQESFVGKTYGMTNSEKADYRDIDDLLYTTNEYNEPTYTKKVVNCAIFQKQRKTINAEGQEILSVSKVAVKNKFPVRTMIFEGETAETTPPFNSQEVKMFQV